MEVTPTDPAATGSLDQAPVQVSITTASVAKALMVPIDALLARPGGVLAGLLPALRAARLSRTGALWSL